MKFEFAPQPNVLIDLQLSNPRFVEDTSFATIWRVTRARGEDAALKLYHQKGMRNEAKGFEFLSSRDGNGAAHVFEVSDQFALIEWLDGPSLGDLTRAGEDEKSCMLLVEVANKLHGSSPEVSANWPDLEDWFGSLFRLAFSADADQRDAGLIDEAKKQARHLLDSQTDMRPLHGDLHHDNIRLGARGFCAFDAKGVVGERTYELANAFRNPKGARELVFDRHRIELLADHWSQSFDVNRERLLQWAFVKCALSIAWRAKGNFVKDDETELLGMLIEALRR